MIPITRHFARRQVLVALANLPIVVALAAVSSASTSQEDQFRTALARAEMPFPNARLELIRFKFDGNELSAVVRMTWPAGLRQRKISVSASDPNQALAALILKTISEFSSAI